MLPEANARELSLEFCGEWYSIPAGKEFFIGRESDLVIDDNPYLHRKFLRIYTDFGLWWLANVGQLLSATVSDSSGRVQAWLAPGARLPIVFETMHVMFSAGTTTYDFTIHSAEDFFNTSPPLGGTGIGTTTMAAVTLTTSQRLLLIALSEKVLGQSVPGRSELPTSTEAAKRLGWSMAAFNRKLDNVCDKLDKIGVSGLRGGKGNLATHRRARLVEYAVATHLVGPEDLELLDRASANKRDEAASQE